MKKFFAYFFSLFIFSTLFSTTYAGKGSGAVIFSDKVENKNGTPQITVTVTWTDNTTGTCVPKNESITVSLAPGDNHKAVRDKTKAALDGNSNITSCFTTKSDDAGFGSLQIVKLNNKDKCYACSVTVLNDVQNNPASGLGSAGSTDPTYGTVQFDLFEFGQPLSGTVEIRVNGKSATSEISGKTLHQVADELLKQLENFGLLASRISEHSILIKEAIVDSLYNLNTSQDLSTNKEESLNGLEGGAAFKITGTGIGIQGIAAQACKCLPSLVDLNKFVAIPKNNGVSLSWTTKTELDSQGFRIWRAIPDLNRYCGCSGNIEDYTQIQVLDKEGKPVLIPTKGSKTSGSDYSYLDEEAKPGIAYCYALEDVDSKGESKFYFEYVAFTQDNLEKSE